MKQSNLDNEEIAVKDDRILRLDKIVREVKESEEAIRKIKDAMAEKV